MSGVLYLGKTYGKDNRLAVESITCPARKAYQHIQCSFIDYYKIDMGFLTDDFDVV
jgi:hypothetical protein